MSDDEWWDLKGPWQRVRWARRRWQKANDQEDNATLAAQALGIKDGTYRAYERSPRSKSTKLTYERAKEFARKFKVSWIWLLSGEQSPFTEDLSEPQKRLTQAMSGFPEEQQERFANAATELLQIFDEK
jgi:hypothetical protein